MSGAVVTSSLLPEPKKRRDAEHQLQKAVCQYLKFASPGPGFTWHSNPNGGQRHSVVARKMVAEGLKAGIPDLLCIWHGHPIYIELKTPRGALSAVQKQKHQELVAAGADVLVLRSGEGVECALREMGVPLRGTFSGFRP